MTGTNPPRDPERERRRHIVRRATLYMYGFFLAAFLLAAAGAALVAWLLQAAGLPFLVTWIAVTVLVLLIPITGAALRGRRSKKGGQD